MPPPQDGSGPIETVAELAGFDVDACAGMQATIVPVRLVEPEFQVVEPLYSSVRRLPFWLRSNAGIGHLAGAGERRAEVQTISAPRLIVTVPSDGPSTSQLTGIVVRPSQVSPLGA